MREGKQNKEPQELPISPSSTRSSPSYSQATKRRRCTSHRWLPHSSRKASIQSTHLGSPTLPSPASVPRKVPLAIQSPGAVRKVGRVWSEGEMW